MNKKNIWIACGVALTGVVLLILGIAIGRGLGNGLSRTSPAGYDKLNAVLNMIDEQYVDTVNKQDLTELTIKALMESLDPHSEYIPKSQLTAVNEDLDGSFSGVGISFQIVQDTVTVVEVITGGPAEKLGILAGDRIIKADNKPLAGPGVTNDDVFKTLRGKKGTKVTLSVLRRGASEPLPFTLTRDDIPVNSVDVAYMLDDKKTGYLKLAPMEQVKPPC